MRSPTVIKYGANMKKPQKPKRSKVIQRIELYDGMPLSDILDSIPSHAHDLAVFTKEYDYADDGGYYTLYFQWKEEESEETFSIKRSQYSKRLAKYNKWVEDNKDALEEKAEQVAEKEKKKLEEEIKRGIERIKDLQTKLEKLK
jgi:hypothetical protein